MGPTRITEERGMTMTNPGIKAITQEVDTHWWHPFSYQLLEKDPDLVGLPPEARMLGFGLSELANKFGRVPSDLTALSRMLGTHRNTLAKYYGGFLGKFVVEKDGYLIPIRTPPGHVTLPPLAPSKKTKGAKEKEPPPPPPAAGAPPVADSEPEDLPNPNLIDILGITVEKYCRLLDSFMNQVITACKHDPKSRKESLEVAKLYRDAVLAGNDSSEIHRALAETHPGDARGVMSYRELIKWFEDHYPA